MTEDYWLSNEDPQGHRWSNMVEFLRGRASERKLRLLSVAACRRIWHLIVDDRSRRAIDVLERFIEQEANREELVETAVHAQEAADELLATDPLGSDPYTDARIAAKIAAGSPYAGKDIVTSLLPGFCAGLMGFASSQQFDRIAITREVVAFCDLIREIVGNPFRSVRISEVWLTWNNATVVKIAQAVYDERAFERLPILADALEDAGCDDADILRHCREPSEHVRGCWVIDLLLGKQ